MIPERDFSGSVRSERHRIFGFHGRRDLNIREIALYAMLGAVMFTSKKLMEVLPNIHLLGLLITAFTVVYRKKALYPVFTYVLLDGIFGGFSLWWIPYLYIWPVLCGMVLLLPRNMNDRLRVPVYALTAGIHGLLFGVLYAPVQAFLFGLDLRGMYAWILAGLPFDCIQAVSNFVFGLLTVPLSRALRKLNRVVFPELSEDARQSNNL